MRFRLGGYADSIQAAHAALDVEGEPHLRNVLRSLIGRAHLAVGEPVAAQSAFDAIESIEYPAGQGEDFLRRWTAQTAERAEYLAGRSAASSGHGAPDRLVSPRHDWAHIDDELASGRSSYVVLDDFLVPEAAHALRDHLLERATWLPQDNDSEYICTLDLGFATGSIVARLGGISACLPKSLSGHPLVEAWAYHYRDYSGCTKRHADYGRFSLNFWLTPDEFNLRSDVGGLKIWGDEQVDAGSHVATESLVFGERLDGDADVIAHRFNRVVIFDAMTLHETDHYEFSTRYDGRRTNVTFLYGWPAGTES